MKLLLVTLAAVIFSVVSIAGLVVLRGLTNLALRGILFLVLCYVAVLGSFRLALKWDLDPFDLGVAWTLALVAVVTAAAISRSRRKGRVVNAP
ncbi:MAG TPA: hypothetical protein VGN73_01035 [Gemmatimonadaceae bacterium]|jgi:lysylphosphatidylglycerol synthetase-like protein (DUF2156 family)|nr:hypothetical protein [Gemmatimonadaceae bacterium]